MEKTPQKRGRKPVTHTELLDLSEINSILTMKKRIQQINNFLTPKRKEFLHPTWIIDLQIAVKYLRAQIDCIENDAKFPNQLKLFATDSAQYLQALRRGSAGTQPQQRPDALV